MTEVKTGVCGNWMWIELHNLTLSLPDALAVNGGLAPQRIGTETDGDARGDAAGTTSEHRAIRRPEDNILFRFPVAFALLSSSFLFS